MEYRTQIYLQKKHYQFLKGQAEKEGISLAEAVRKLIEKEMPSDKTWEDDPIWNVEKINFHSGYQNASQQHHTILRERLKNKQRKL